MSATRKTMHKEVLEELLRIYDTSRLLPLLPMTRAVARDGEMQGSSTALTLLKSYRTACMRTLFFRDEERPEGQDAEGEPTSTTAAMMALLRGLWRSGPWRDMMNNMVEAAVARLQEAAVARLQEAAKVGDAAPLLDLSAPGEVRGQASSSEISLALLVYDVLGAHFETLRLGGSVLVHGQLEQGRRRYAHPTEALHAL
jgi:hypothetical protein